MRHALRGPVAEREHAYELLAGGDDAALFHGALGKRHRHPAGVQPQRLRQQRHPLAVIANLFVEPAAFAADALPAAPLEDTPRDDTLQQALQAQEEAQALAKDVQELLALREHELQQAQALIERLEAALEVDSKLL